MEEETKQEDEKKPELNVGDDDARTITEIMKGTDTDKRFEKVAQMIIGIVDAINRRPHPDTIVTFPVLNQFSDVALKPLFEKVYNVKVLKREFTEEELKIGFHYPRLMTDEERAEYKKYKAEQEAEIKPEIKTYHKVQRNPRILPGQRRTPLSERAGTIREPEEEGHEERFREEFEEMPEEEPEEEKEREFKIEDPIVDSFKEAGCVSPETAKTLKFVFDNFIKKKEPEWNPEMVNMRILRDYEKQGKIIVNRSNRPHKYHLPN